MKLIYRLFEHSALLRGITGCICRSKNLRRDVLGISLDTPFGAGPGTDSGFRDFNTLASFGASFVMSGPVTARPAADNPGVSVAARRLRHGKAGTKVFACITDDSTNSKDAVKGYEMCFAMLYDFADAIVVIPHIDSTQNIIDESFTEIMDNLLSLRLYYDIYKPIFIQIPTGIPNAQIEEMISFCLTSGIEGIVTDVGRVEFVRSKSQSRLTIIATMDSSVSDKVVLDVLQSGASLVAFTRKGSILRLRRFKEASGHLNKYYKQTKATH